MTKLTGPALVAYLRDNPTSDDRQAAADEIEQLRTALGWTAGALQYLALRNRPVFESDVFELDKARLSAGQILDLANDALSPDSIPISEGTGGVDIRVKMPEPVAVAVNDGKTIVDLEFVRGVVVERGRHCLVTTTQAEAYAQALVKEALEKAELILEANAEAILSLIPKDTT